MLKYNHFKFLEEKLDAAFNNGITFPDDVTIEDQLVVMINIAYSSGLDMEEDDLRRALAVYRSRDGVYLESFGYSTDGIVQVELPDVSPGEYTVSHSHLIAAAKKVGNFASFIDAVKIFSDHSVFKIGLTRLDLLLLDALGAGDVLSFSLGGTFAPNQGVEFLRNVAMHSIKQQHPMWFDAQGAIYANANQIKNDGVDSFEMTEIRNLATEVLLRREKAAKSALERKRQKIAVAKAKRAEVFAKLDAACQKDEKFQTTIGDFVKLNFNELKDLTTFVLPLQLDEDEQPFLIDYVYTKVKAMQPDWFIESEEGFLKMKRSIPKVRARGVDRVTRAVQKALEKLVVKYGRDKVVEVLETIPATLSPATTETT